MRQLIKQRIKNEKGLTLIELLAVIVILGIIAAIAIPSIANIIEKSRFDAIKADGIQVINATKLYIAGNGTEDTNIDATDLADYLDNETTLADGYTLDVVNGQIQLTGSATKGNVNVTFTAATITGINQATKAAEGDTTISN
ncbi:prepilin-type N-terminal cleavage/methylation domain-containing protein [Bacillus sp. B1-b2]|uniref:prepilin-type N-terminal cleavage/methylation domain-containing protein n=1 Tax=Bacillus sp. B1-b2 TaxID=2653201 RepID=UPI001261684B|nr:prepilin-type N-terminal cleavage/methylation domain-containing protein [Bacillus sp. B1-b2]KAB7667342.1 prepilin-type N-terminal cleavage/methylation domain-containing protein [Bacillus sp. B1-b2]